MSLEAKIRETLGGKSYSWLVTGGAGFIGSHTVEQLVALNQKVRVLDNFSTGRVDFLAALNERLKREKKQTVEVVKGDLADLLICEKAVEGTRFVIHLAGLCSVPQSFLLPQLTQSSNVTGFLNILTSAQKFHVQKMVYASSSAVYGQNEKIPLREEDVGVPLSPYALSKLSNEYYSKFLEKNGTTRFVGLRYFNVFGPRQDPNGSYAAVIPKWILEFIKGQTPSIYGDGQTIRDFCSVRDVALVNILMALTPTRSSIFNVGSGEGLSLLELFKKLSSAFNKSKDPRMEGERTGDIRKSLADISRLRSELGFEPISRFDDALRETCDWFLSTN